MDIEIVVYHTAKGKEPYTEWLNKLDEEAKDKVSIRLRRLKSGLFGDCKNLKGGVYELRLHYGEGLRVYYGREGKRIVLLLSGGTKKRQSKDIERAKKCWLDYKTREGKK